MISNVYNVGSNKMNHTREVCELINEQIPNAFFIIINKDPDKRNPEVSYDKINSLGFDVEVNLETGIQEIKDCVVLLENSLKYRNV